MTSRQGIAVEQVREAFRRSRLVPSDAVIYGHFDSGDRRACATAALLVADGVTYDGLRDLLRADAYTPESRSAYADRLSDALGFVVSRGYVIGFDRGWDTGQRAAAYDPHALDINGGEDYRRGWADGDAARRALLGEDA